MNYNDYDNLPDKKGYFGKFGGMYIPEILFPAIKELTDCYNLLKKIKILMKNINII